MVNGTEDTYGGVTLKSHVMESSERSSWWTWRRITLAVVAALLLVAGTIGVAALVDWSISPRPKTEPPIDASEVFAHFKSNPKAAESWYRDKDVTIVGVVDAHEVPTQSRSGIVILCDHGSRTDLAIAGFFWSQTDKISWLRNGDIIAFSGRYIGRSQKNSNLLEFNDCVLLSP